MNATPDTARGKSAAAVRDAKAKKREAAPARAAELAPAIPLGPVSYAIDDLAQGVRSSLQRLNTMIGNRSLWADAIDGCRDARASMEHVSERLAAILEGANGLESSLTAARAEIDGWGKIHAELAAVERALRSELEERRAEGERRGRELGALSAQNQTLRAECAQHRKRSAEYEAAIEREQQLRTECDGLRAAARELNAKIEKQDGLIARSRSLAQALLDDAPGGLRT